MPVLSVCLSVFCFVGLSVSQAALAPKDFALTLHPQNKGTCSTVLETGCKPVLFYLIEPLTPLGLQGLSESWLEALINIFLFR